MPKKKRHHKLPKDFTISDYANAQKPHNKVKKSITTNAKTENLDVSWDQIPESQDIDIVKELNSDGTTNLVCIKRQKSSLPKSEGQGNEYPEVVWYEISRRLDPEDIGRFAGINRTTLSITKTKSFWVSVYEKYCNNSPQLPRRLRIEEGAKTYGYKSRVIRALYHTHNAFRKKATALGEQFSQPQDMMKCRCVNMWYREINAEYSTMFFKFKKLPQHQASCRMDYDFIDELGRLDANPELDNKVLQVNCKLRNQVPPLVIGMTLTSARMGLARNMRSNSLVMGFNSGTYVAKNVQPECTLFLDNILKIMVIDWWHPNYPNFVIRFPSEDMDGPLLDRNFFTLYNDKDSDLNLLEQQDNKWDNFTVSRL